MRKITFIYLIFFITFLTNCFSQTSDEILKNYYELPEVKNDLKGKIRSGSETTYESSDTLIFSSEQQFEKYNYYVDDYDKITKLSSEKRLKNLILASKDSTVLTIKDSTVIVKNENSIQVSKYLGESLEVDPDFTTYHFDSQNKLTFIDLALDKRKKKIFKYDKNNLLIEINDLETSNEDDLKYVFKYDLKKQVREIKCFDTKNALKKYFKYKYKKNKVSELIYKSEGKEFIDNFKYDSVGNKVEFIHRKISGELISISTRKFNNRNNVYEYKIINYKNGKIADGFTQKNSYQYDKNENWIKIITTYSNKKNYSVTTRNINYIIKD